MKRLLGIWILTVVLCMSATAFAAVEYRSGSREMPRIAITMDDCFSGEMVKQALEICRNEEVPMTFFVVGSELLDKDIEIWQQVVTQGCEIGNHTWGHVALGAADRTVVLYQLRRTQARLDEVLGYHYAMQVMRPPYGNLQKKDTNNRSRTVAAIEEAGYGHIVLWDVSGTETNKLLHAVQNGSIILMHTNPPDVKCLAELIPALKEKGYELVTVSTLLGLPPAEISDDIYVFEY